MARLVAHDLPVNSVVNLGIGLPTRVARYVADRPDVVLHSENGILGMGPPPLPGAEDPNVIDAGKSLVTLRLGAAIVNQADSFAVVRGGRLDVAVLGAYQVSEHGDLASWMVANERLGSVGGAMDLVVGSRHVWVMMHHQDKLGRPKIVEKCSYPLTGKGCVRRVYSDLAVMDITQEGVLIREHHPRLTLAEVQAATDTVVRLSNRFTLSENSSDKAPISY